MGGSLDAPALIRYLKPELVGRDPLERESLLQRMLARARYTRYRAIGALDIALWDIAGMAAGLPVYRLLGSYREKVAAYASSEQLASHKAHIEQALSFKAVGWPAYKIHPPHVSVPDDILLCQEVRKAVGDDYTLMLDATWHYDFPSAMKVGRALEELRYEWYEDPLSEHDIYNCAKLYEKLDIPLVATEYPQQGIDGYAPWILLKATDALRGDVAVKGGITTLIKIAHLAEAFNMKLEIHHGGNSLNNFANLHVMLAIKNSSMFEVLLPDDFDKVKVTHLRGL